MTCRDCQFLSVPLDKAGRRVPRKWNVYPCTVPFEPGYIVPRCITVAISKKHMMGPDDGAGCLFHEKVRR